MFLEKELVFSTAAHHLYLKSYTRLALQQIFEEILLFTTKRASHSIQWMLLKEGRKTHWCVSRQWNSNECFSQTLNLMATATQMWSIIKRYFTPKLSGLWVFFMETLLQRIVIGQSIMKHSKFWNWMLLKVAISIPLGNFWVWILRLINDFISDSQ